MNKNLSDPDKILQKAEECIQHYISHTFGLNHFRRKTFDKNSNNLSSYFLLAEKWIKAVTDVSRCVAVLIHKSGDRSVCGHSSALDKVLPAVNNFSYFDQDNRPKGEYGRPDNRPHGEYGNCAEPLAWNKVRNTVNPEDYSNWVSVAFGTPTAQGKNTDVQLTRLIKNFPGQSSIPAEKADFLNKEMPKIWGILASNPWWSLRPPCERCMTWVMPDGIAPKDIWTGKDKLGGAIVFKDGKYQIATKVSDLPQNDYLAENRVWDFWQRLQW